MPNGNSPQLQIPLMAENDTLKYLLNNDGFNAIDNALNRFLAVDMTSGNVALTESQFTRNGTFQCSGHTVTRTLTVPSTVGSAPVVTVNRFFIVINDGTGDVDVTGGGGANQTIGPSSSAMLASDGTIIYLISRNIVARDYQEEGGSIVTDPTFVNFIGNTVTAALSAGGVNVTVTSLAVQDDAVGQTTDTTVLDFTGGGVAVTPTGSSAAINIPGVNVEDESSLITTAASAINFLGNAVSVVNNAGVADVTMANPGVSEDGVSVLTDIATFDFVGDAVGVSNPSAGVGRIELNGVLGRAFKGAMVNLTGDEALAAATPEVLVWDAAEYDFGLWTDIGGSNPERLTIPAGITRVRLTANALFADATGQAIVRILKNGSDILGGGATETETTGTEIVNVMSAILVVTPGDYFEMEVEATNVRNITFGTDTFFSIEAITPSADTFETSGRQLGFAGWSAPGNIFTAINSGTPDTNAYDAGDDSWEMETVGPDGVALAGVAVTAATDFDVVFAIRGRLPNDADAEIGVYYGNTADADRTMFKIDEAGVFAKTFYNTDTTFGSDSATDAIGRVYNDFPRHGTFYMRLTLVGAVTSMQYSADGIDWVEVFTGTPTENTMTDIDEVGLFLNSTNVVAGEIVKLRCVGYDVGPQTEIITGLNAHFPIEDATTARVALNSDFRGNRTIYFTNAAAITYTINTGNTGTEPVVIAQTTAAGQITITAGGGVTLKSAAGLKTIDQYSHVVITPDKFNADEFYISGRTEV